MFAFPITTTIFLTPISLLDQHYITFNLKGITISRVKIRKRYKPQTLELSIGLGCFLQKISFLFHALEIQYNTTFA